MLASHRGPASLPVSLFFVPEVRRFSRLLPAWPGGWMTVGVVELAGPVAAPVAATYARTGTAVAFIIPELPGERAEALFIAMAAFVPTAGTPSSHVNCQQPTGANGNICEETNMRDVNARDAGDKLNDRELFDQIFGICGASLSATTRAAGGTLLLLYTHDDQRDQLIRDPSLIPEAIEECLRLGSNGYFTFPRIATRDTEVGGTRIRKGMVVRPSPLAPNYDPHAFPDPLRFDIHRKPKRILSFGAGPHHCIGNILGRTTITIAIMRLLTRFPKAHLSDLNFTPVYGGAVGELRLQSLPMLIQ
jgi:hypothetical protein